MLFCIHMHERYGYKVTCPRMIIGLNEETLAIEVRNLPTQRRLSILGIRICKNGEICGASPYTRGVVIISED